MKEKNVVILLLFAIGALVLFLVITSLGDTVTNIVLVICWLLIFASFLKQKRYIFASLACLALLFLIFTRFVFV